MGRGEERDEIEKMGEERDEGDVFLLLGLRGEGRGEGEEEEEEEEEE
jgi:hypothetical protein